MNEEGNWDERSDSADSPGRASDIDDDTMSDVDRNYLETFIVPCVATHSFTLPDITNAVSVVFKGVRTRGPFPREAAKRGAMQLCIKFIHSLGASISQTATKSTHKTSTAVVEEYQRKVAKGLHVAYSIVKHASHVAVAAAIVACKHRGESLGAESLVSFMKFQAKELMENAGETKDIVIEVQALELMLEQMSIKSGKGIGFIPEHHMRPVSMLFTAVLGISGSNKRQVVQCALLLVQSAYTAGSPVLLNSGDCCLSSLIVAAALAKLSIPDNLLDRMTHEKASWTAAQVASREQNAADTGDWDSVIPKFDLMGVKGGIKMLNGSQSSSDNVTVLNEAVGKYASGFV